MQSSDNGTVDKPPVATLEENRSIHRSFRLSRKSLQIWIRKLKMRILTIVICLKFAKSASQPSSPRPDKSSNKQLASSESTQSQLSEAPETYSSTPKSNSSSNNTPRIKDNYPSESTQEATSSSIKRYGKKRKYQALRHYPGSKEKSNSEPSSPRRKRVEYDSDQLKYIRASCNSCCSQPPEVDFEELDRLIQEEEADERTSHLLNWEKEDWERAKRVEKRCKSSLGLYSVGDLGRNVGPGLDALIWARPEVMVYSFHPTKNLSPATVYAKRPKLHWNMQKPIPEDETLWRNSLRAYHKTRKKASAHHYNKQVGRDPKEGHFRPNGIEGSTTKKPSDRQGLTTLDYQGKSKRIDSSNQLKHKQQNEKFSKYSDTGSLSVGSFYPQVRDRSPSSPNKQSWYQRGRSPEKAWFPGGHLSDYSSSSPSPRSSPEGDKKKEVRVDKPLARKVILRDPTSGGKPDIIVKKLYLVSDSANRNRNIRQSPKKKVQQDSKASGNSSYTQAFQTTASEKEGTKEDPSTLRRDIPLTYPKSTQENGENSPENNNFALIEDEVEDVCQNQPYKDNLLPCDLETTASQLTAEPRIVMRAAPDPTTILINEGLQTGNFEDAHTQQEDEEDTYLEKDTEREDTERLQTLSSKSLDDMELLNSTYGDAKAEPSRQRSTGLADFAMYQKSDNLGTFNDTATDADQVHYLQFTDHSLDKLLTMSTSDAELIGSQSSKTTDISDDHSLDCPAVVTTADAKDESPRLKTNSTADPNVHHKLESLLDLLVTITTAATEDESDHPQSPRSTVDLDMDHSVDLYDTGSEADARDESHQVQPSETAYLDTDHSSNLHGTGSEADTVYESHRLRPCRTAALDTDRTLDPHDTATVVHVKDEPQELQSSRTADLGAVEGLLDTIATANVRDEPHKLQSRRTAGLDVDQSLLRNTTMADVKDESNYPQSTVTTDIVVDRGLYSNTTVNKMKIEGEPPHLQPSLTAILGVDHRLEPLAAITMADSKDNFLKLHSSNAADLAHIDNSDSLSTVTVAETEYEPHQVAPSVEAYIQVDHTYEMLATNTTGRVDESGFQRTKLNECLLEHAQRSERKHHKRSFSEGSYNNLANSRFPGQPIQRPNKKPRMRDEESQVDFYGEVFTFQQERVTSTSDRDEQTQTSSANSEHGDSDLVSHRYVRPLARLSPNDDELPYSKPGLYQVLEPPEDAIGGKILATSLIRSVSVTGENSHAASPTNPASPSSKHSNYASPSAEKTVSCTDEILEYKDITNDLSTFKRNGNTRDHFYLRRRRSYRRSRVTVRSSVILRRVKDFGPGRQPIRRSRIIDGIEDDILAADRTRRRPSTTQRSGSVELNDLIPQELRSLNPNLPEFNFSNSDDRKSISSLSAISSESSYDGNFRPGTPVSDLSRLSSSASELGIFRARKPSTTQAPQSNNSRGRDDPNIDGRNNSSSPNTHDGLENWQVSEQNSPISETGSVSDMLNKSKGGEEGNHSSFSSVSGGNSGSGRTHSGRQSRVILRSSIKSVAMREYDPGIPVRSSQTVDLSGTDDPGLVKFRRRPSSQVSVRLSPSAKQRGRSMELNNLIFRELAKDPTLRNRITFQSDTDDKRSPNNSSRSSSMKYNSPASPASDTENVNGTNGLAFLDREARTYGSVTLDGKTFSRHVLSLGTETQQTEVFHSSVEEHSHEQYLVRGIPSPGAPHYDLREMAGRIPSPGAANTTDHEGTLLQPTNALDNRKFHASYGIVIRQSGSEESSKTDAERPNFTGKREGHRTESSTSQGDDNPNQEMMSNTASAMATVSQADEQNYGDALNSGQHTACLYNTDENESLPLSPHQITVSSGQCSEPKLPQWMEKWKGDRFADFPPAPLPSVSRNQGVDSPPPTPSDGPPSTPPHQIEFLQAFWSLST